MAEYETFMLPIKQEFNNAVMSFTRVTETPYGDASVTIEHQTFSGGVYYFVFSNFSENTFFLQYYQMVSVPTPTEFPSFWICSDEDFEVELLKTSETVPTQTTVSYTKDGKTVYYYQMSVYTQYIYDEFPNSSFQIIYNKNLIYDYQNPSETHIVPDGYIYPALRPDICWEMVYGERVDGYNPYEFAGTSYPAGGDGTFSFSSTDIAIPGLPSIGVYNTGFCGLYNPGILALKALADYLWTGAFSIENFKKLFTDPMDAILGLHIIPTIPGHPATTNANLFVGNQDTGISMARLTEQYYELDCGTVEIPAKWGAYLDFSPYTKLQLWLPYIGYVTISPDDCMKGSIKVVYHVDMMSGACTAFVYCYSNDGTNGHVLYTFSGMCACQCPITSGDHSNMLSSIVGAVAGVGLIASGGGAVPIVAGVGQVANSIVSAVKPEISRSGSFSGAGGLMGIQYPYLILTVPKMCTPKQQNVYKGYPSFITKQMVDIKGYTEIDVSHLNNMTCSGAEMDEIIAILENGVIF